MNNRRNTVKTMGNDLVAADALRIKSASQYTILPPATTVFAEAAAAMGTLQKVFIKCNLFLLELQSSMMMET